MVSSYSRHQVFNFGETGLVFKMLPAARTYATQQTSSARRRKAPKDRVTLGVCTNASGSIRHSLVFIGKQKNPSAFKNRTPESLKVNYYNQRNAWMDAGNFEHWFRYKFIPFVSLKLQNMGSDKKALLLVDNCSAHPNPDEISTSKFLVTFLPPKVTSLIQPMDQGVIETLKRLYKKVLLRDFLLALETPEITSYEDFMKTVNLFKVCNLISNCWEEVSIVPLQSSWQN